MSVCNLTNTYVFLCLSIPSRNFGRGLFFYAMFSLDCITDLLRCSLSLCLTLMPCHLMISLTVYNHERRAHRLFVEISCCM